MRPFDVDHSHATDPSPQHPIPRRLIVREEMLESPFSLMVPKLMLRLASFDRRKDAQQCELLLTRLEEAVESGVVPLKTTTTHSAQPPFSPSSRVLKTSILPPLKSTSAEAKRAQSDSLPSSSSPSSTFVAQSVPLASSVRYRVVVAQEWITELAAKYRNLANLTDAL
jgi:hypothetical protein